jgi:hypothetical protein
VRSLGGMPLSSDDDDNHSDEDEAD